MPKKYALEAVIGRTPSTVVFRGVRIADGRRVVVKQLQPDASPRARGHLEHEFELLKSTHSRFTLEAYALETVDGLPALILEDFGGQPLDQLLGAPLPIDRFLEIAIAVTAALADVHRRGIVHRDVKPENILINPATGETRIADFGIALHGPSARSASRRPALIEGSLAYISPEQTGRLNRATDSRGDLYSLGVTFYRMLAGKLPLSATDPMGWVHSHIARAPVPLGEVVPAVPEPLSAVIMKLLAKAPEDRYQSALGLQRDLEECRRRWATEHRIDPFPLGENDVEAGHEKRPQLLVGSEAEASLALAKSAYWTQPIQTALDATAAAFDAGIASGDRGVAGWACAQAVTTLLARGDRLEDVLRESDEWLDRARRAEHRDAVDVIAETRRYVQSLQGHTDLDENPLEGSPDAAVLCAREIFQVEARFLAGDDEGALASAERASDLLSASPSPALTHDLVFHHALALAARQPGGPREGLERLRAHGAQLEEWARRCPSTFSCTHALVAAEIARIAGQTDEAMQSYEDAIRSAREHGVPRNEALAYEIASRFYRDGGYETFADTYLREARACYSRWGAERKARTLDRRFPHLVEPRPLAPTLTFAMQAEQFDLLTVVKSSQAISGQMVLPRLLDTLLGIVLEHAGAEKGYVLLAQGDSYAVHAGGEAVPLSPAVLPVSIVREVGRTRETVLLDDAATPSRFSSDEYVARVRPRSVLCMPIDRRGEALGMLYLENNLVAGAFTADKLAVLELLATQAAVSIENATLYSELQKNEHLIEAIIDNSPAVIYAKDLEGRYLFINKQYANTFHTTKEAMVGKRDHDFWPAEIAALFHDTDRIVLESGAPLEREDLAPHDDGLHPYLSMKFPLRDASGAIYGVCGVAADITDRKRSEVERERLLLSAQEALRARETFLSVASHELRTPLTALNLQLQNVRRAVGGPLGIRIDTEQLTERLDRADRQVKRLIGLVDTMLDISRLQTKGVQLTLESVDLGEIVREVLESLGDARRAVSWRGSKSAVGRWDRLKVWQVVTNLVTNAVKFGQGKPIEIVLDERPEAVTLTVRDHGIGVSDADQERIFQPFERAVSSRHYGGLGLGLFIARQFVEAHGGTLSLESVKAAGSTFTVTLPRRSAPHADPAPGPSSVSSSTRPAHVPR